MPLKRFTLEDVLKTDYCNDYDSVIIEKLWARYVTTDSPNALDLLRAAGIPASNRIRLLFSLELLPTEAVYRFRAALAYKVAPIYEKQTGGRAEVRDCARLWLRAARGDSSGLAAGLDAAWDAAWDAGAVGGTLYAAWAARDAWAARAAARVAELDAMNNWMISALLVIARKYGAE